MTIENPFPFFAALRREAPLYEMPNGAYWLVSRLQDCRRIVLDTDTFSSRLVGFMVGDEGSAPRLLPLPEGVATNVLAIADPPDHTRQRKLVNQAFATRRVAALEDGVVQLVDELLDSMLDSPESADAMRDYAIPLPMTVICQLLGLPMQDRHDLQALSDDAISLVDGINTPEQVERYGRSAGKLGAYLAERLRETDNESGENVLGTLAAACASSALSEDEAAAILLQLITAGQETTGGLIGSAIMLLGQNPDIQRRLRDDLDLVPALVEETLRLESPFYGHFRQVTRPTEIAGQSVAVGTKLMILWASANRDESEFPDPDVIKLDRPNPRNHFGFGHGMHFCIGAELARMETRVALTRLLQRTTWIDLTGDRPRHLRSLFVRRLTGLSVAIEV